MTYDEVAKAAAALSYRDKFRLAQLLIQAARKEEEDQHPHRVSSEAGAPEELDPSLIDYVAERLRKLRPVKKDAALNSIGAMFQFRGGIGEDERQRILASLQAGGHVSIDASGRLSYPARA